MQGTRIAPRPGKQALIVIGMHRSGTSATTGGLQCLGVQLGKKLYTGHRDINAKGYFEHSGIADTNEEALQALGSGWDDVLLKEEGWWKRDCLEPYAKRIRESIQRDFSGSLLWAVKDPRICRLLPWWLDILAAGQVRPHFLFVVRSPADVSRSLARRDGFSREKAYLLWTLHYLEAERWSSGFPRAYVDFDRFVERPQAEMARVEQDVGLSFPVSPAAAGDCLEQFVSRDLRHHQETGDPDTGTPILDLGRALHAHLLHAAGQGGQGIAADVLAGMWQEMENIQKTFPTALVDHVRTLTQRRGEMQLTLNRLIRSWSWVTGKPVRFLERKLGRDV